MAGSRILVVDGDGPGRMQEEGVLRSMGYEVEATESGASAVGILQTSKVTYDAVLAAISLPDMNGVELLSRVHQLPRRVPFILMLDFGWDAGPLIAQARALGLSRGGVVYKPLIARQVEAALMAALLGD